MKILHTSDWHIGRTFHAHSTLAHFERVAEAMADIVREQRVDVVVVAGDVFDSAVPSAESYEVLTRALRGLRATGAKVVVTSGNHDSATRLGFQSEWAAVAGVHVITRHQALHEPVTLGDVFGPVHFYGIPYLEPSLIRHHYPDHLLRTHEQALGFAMGRIRADQEARGGRSVVLAHCFAVGVQASTVERDITSGGLDLVPLGVFDGPDYVALGHIHSRSTLSERVRYSGAPLHYSFSEGSSVRGGWLVELDAAGLTDTTWVDFPVPRAARELTGTLDDLLGDASLAPYEGHWIKAVLTDEVRPLDGMRRLQQRFVHCVALEHRPAVTHDAGAETYAERVTQKSDQQIVSGFVEFVRNGSGPSDFERQLVSETLVALDT
ncbi:exonuclease SbcCD subunit D [Subtercola boreus]|uniref:Nuclease SbcCD subunit D n=1 Tax=Subtercola boreus TaxID=120213 RepID=A0A3E0WFJ8_9MICO|nr:exonuclease SbcCD subunit D [Subtercola boreus]RFA22817.1 exonuclease sbcCD subunit D [Subtercola boreus]RFA23172.1 exonuclease sbcCD subunit D [Subtercola boreus]RFA28925.1 exonuclease sbcCD subunit D [Subtercola boreus]